MEPCKGSIYFSSVQSEHLLLTTLQMLILSFLFFCAGPYVRLIVYFLFTLYPAIRLRRRSRIPCYTSCIKGFVVLKQSLSSTSSSLSNLDSKRSRKIFRLTFRELESFSCFLSSRFLTLHHTWISGHKPVCFQ